MPIYEFYCPDCHRLLSFLSRSVNTEKRPACPRCGRPDLARRVSSFAISKGLKEEPPAPAAEPGFPGLPPGMDEARLEQAMSELARDAEGMNEDDPRQGAHLMRRLFASTGLPLGTGMEEALRRMESGEDPEKIEEDMGDTMEDPFGMGGPEEANEKPRGALSRLRRRVLPPTIDPELHEL